ncbi:MAG: hypothetical protein ACKPH7_06495 [Planktothrix sp.]|uniref:hypothetical protein n=1 Tax=Planktothrix sp. TaxID=3088171 RepID=UPI0038D4F2E2
MNAGKPQRFFVDSNIWLYRFIVNPNDSDARSKQQIATSITSQGNLTDYQSIQRFKMSDRILNSLKP